MTRLKRGEKKQQEENEKRDREVEMRLKPPNNENRNTTQHLESGGSGGGGGNVQFGTNGSVSKSPIISCALPLSAIRAASQKAKKGTRRKPELSDKVPETNAPHMQESVLDKLSNLGETKPDEEPVAKINKNALLNSVPETSNKHLSVPETCNKYQSVPEISNNYQNVPETSNKHQSFPEISNKHQSAPETSNKHKSVSESSTKFSGTSETYKDSFNVFKISDEPLNLLERCEKNNKTPVKNSETIKKPKTSQKPSSVSEAHKILQNVAEARKELFSLLEANKESQSVSETIKKSKTIQETGKKPLKVATPTTTVKQKGHKRRPGSGLFSEQIELRNSSTIISQPVPIKSKSSDKNLGIVSPLSSDVKDFEVPVVAKIDFKQIKYPDWGTSEATDSIQSKYLPGIDPRRRALLGKKNRTSNAENLNNNISNVTRNSSNSYTSMQNDFFVSDQKHNPSNNVFQAAYKRTASASTLTNHQFFTQREPNLSRHTGYTASLCGKTDGPVDSGSFPADALYGNLPLWRPNPNNVLQSAFKRTGSATVLSNYQLPIQRETNSSRPTVLIKDHEERSDRNMIGSLYAKNSVAQCDDKRIPWSEYAASNAAGVQLGEGETTAAQHSERNEAGARNKALRYSTDYDALDLRTSRDKELRDDTNQWKFDTKSVLQNYCDMIEQNWDVSSNKTIPKEIGNNRNASEYDVQFLQDLELKQLSLLENAFKELQFGANWNARKLPGRSEESFQSSDDTVYLNMCGYATGGCSPERTQYDVTSQPCFSDYGTAERQYETAHVLPACDSMKDQACLPRLTKKVQKFPYEFYGNESQYDFLNQLTSENGGIGKDPRIYEDLDEEELNDKYNPRINSMNSLKSDTRDKCNDNPADKSEDNVLDEPNYCCACSMKLEGDVMIRELACKHLLHDACTEEWIKRHPNGECSVCAELEGILRQYYMWNKYP